MKRMIRTFAETLSLAIVLYIGILIGCNDWQWHTDGQHQGRTTRRTQQLVPEEFKDLRYIAFGTSRTWGSGLDNRRQAFPFLLSEQATNLAIRAADATTPSLCTVSLVKNAMADVILLEYNLQATPALIRLAKRLRGRFPKATIVFIKVWLPWQFYHIVYKKNLKEILADAGYGSLETYSFDKYQEIVSKTEASDWRFLHDEISSTWIEEARSAVDGIMYELPTPDNSTNPVMALMTYGSIFMWDMTHYTLDGHHFIKRAIWGVLKGVQAERHEELNPWESTDICQSWFEGGKNKDGTTPVHDSHIQMSKFGPGKYALAIHKSHNDSWIEINNPSTRPMEVHIEYMTTDCPTIYPEVRVSLVGSLNNPDGVWIKPEASTITGLTTHIHVIKISDVGVVPPGSTLMRITVVDPIIVMPFRVIGIILSPPDSEF